MAPLAYVIGGGPRQHQLAQRDQRLQAFAQYERQIRAGSDEVEVGVRSLREAPGEPGRSIDALARVRHLAQRRVHARGVCEVDHGGAELTSSQGALDAPCEARQRASQVSRLEGERHRAPVPQRLVARRQGEDRSVLVERARSRAECDLGDLVLQGRIERDSRVVRIRRLAPERSLPREINPREVAPRGQVAKALLGQPPRERTGVLDHRRHDLREPVRGGIGALARCQPLSGVGRESRGLLPSHASCETERAAREKSRASRFDVGQHLETQAQELGHLLRYLSPERHQAFESIVLGGALSGNGMPGFGDLLTPADLEPLRAYLVSEARELYEAQQRARD